MKNGTYEANFQGNELEIYLNFMRRRPRPQALQRPALQVIPYS